MCSPDEAERSIHIIAHPRLILEYLSLRPCRRAAYIRRQTVKKKSGTRSVGVAARVVTVGVTVSVTMSVTVVQ